MINKKLKYSIFLIMLSILFSSCSPLQLTVENLIKAPKLTGELYEIKTALELVVGKDIVLKYPKSGPYRSPFIMHDIDGDGQEEAIVFYSENNADEIKFNILDKIDNKWISIFSDEGPGVEVEKILISNILDEKNDQLIVNWIRANRVDKSLQIYNYKDNSLERIYSKDYLTDVFMYDIDNDNEDEIIVIDRTLRITPNMSVLKRLPGSEELGQVSYVRLRSGSVDYRNITFGKIENNVKGIFLDAHSEEEEYPFYTEVIISAGENKLVNLFYNPANEEIENKRLLNQSVRSQDIFCKDIDNDEIIEIPKTLSYHYQIKLDNKNEILPLTVWSKYKREEVEFCKLSIENVKDGYSFIVPQLWFLKEEIDGRENIEPQIVAVYNEKDGEMYIRDVEDTKNDILTIKIVDSGKGVLDGYEKIGQKNNYIYYLKLGVKKNRFLITEEEVRKRFSLIYGG